MKNRILRASLIIFSALHITACSGHAAGADRVFTNAEIYTVDTKKPWAKAIAIQDGKIVYVGDNQGAQGFIDDETDVIDLEGAMILPGLHDIHMHPLEAGNPIAGTCLLDETTDLNDLPKELGNCADEQLSTVWVTGWGFHLYYLAQLKGTPADVLEAAIPGRPAIFMEATSHSQWINRTGLKMAGITKDTPDPPGGIIVRDKITGEPTGLLLDNAGDMVLGKVYKPTPETMQLTYEGLVEKLDELAGYGLTSIADARVYWTRDHHKIWQRAEREGKLPVRVVLGLWAYPELGDTQLETFQKLYSNNPDDLLRISQIKYYVDGIVVNGTARMKKTYEHGTGLREFPRGLNYFDEDRLTNFIAKTEKMGYDAHIHALGDLGISEGLNAIERAQKINNSKGVGRHRLTHVEIYDKREIPRFAKLGVIADFQLAGDWTFQKTYEKYQAPFIGKRAKRAIPAGSMYKTGALITLSSDYDVSEPNPFVGMSHAIDRGPESLPSLDAAVRAYTINSAFALRQENRTGSLEVGKRADLVVIDRNIFKIKPKEIAETKVLLTLMDGEETYRDEDF